MASARGKIVDRWEFKVAGVKVTLPVKLHLQEANSYHGNAGTWFSVRSDEYEIALDNTDIEQLRKDVEEQLKKSLTIRWDRAWRILFKQEKNTTGKRGLSHCAELDLKSNAIEVGTKPDGTLCWRTIEGTDTGKDDDGKRYSRPYYGQVSNGDPREASSWEGLAIVVDESSDSQVADWIRELCNAVHGLGKSIERSLKSSDTTVISALTARIEAAIK
jgi:hypothetical protein